MAQPGINYSANWKKVEKFEAKGLTKSARDEVTTIYKRAQKDNNDAQQIKACMYLIRYRNMVEEDSRENNIFFVDTLIRNAKAPAKNMLQSMQAEMFWQYLQNNRWKFYNRTGLTEEKSKDIATWSLEKLHSVITKLYDASLHNESLLKQTRLENFEPVIIKGENTRHLRPTLYDFLVHRALDYFVTDETYLIKPAYQFKIDNAAAYAPAEKFCTTSFTTKDTASNHYKAILVFRDIIRFHLNDEKPDALLDADLIRLNFVNQYAVVENKEALYEAALLKIENDFPQNECSAKAKYFRSMIYYNRGQNFSAETSPDNQYEIKRAKELCENAYEKFPKSEGGINCKNLLNRITEPSLNLQTEKVNVPDQAFRTLVQYKNVPTLYVRVVKTSKEELKKISDINDNTLYWKQIRSLKPVRSQTIKLPDLNDYQLHAVEIKIDPLSHGVYLILASINEDFSLQSNIISRQLTYVSNISFVNNGKEYYVTDRENGYPISNAQIQVWQKKYDYQKSKYDEIKAEKYTSDKNGYFKLKEATEYRNIIYQITTDKDELFLDDNHYDNIYNYYEDKNIPPVTFLFSDRSIYRPGQIFYFKGIVVQKNKDAAKSAVIPSFRSHIQLKDANGEMVKDITLITNEYGSYNGSFKLPEGTLNGDFSVYDETTNSSHEFKVEEYKRPKFFTEIQKPSGTYRLNDSISITGTAKGYAGNNIDGANVKYRVVRKVRYPVWWGWGGYGRKGILPYGNNNEVEITNGETVTDTKGEFTVRFKAQPDESIDKKNQPTFFYEVIADVTDINGETRSGETSIAVAYQALQLNIEMPEKINSDSVKDISISSKNLNDIFEKTTVHVTFTKLQSPDKIFRERYWQNPDLFVMSKDEYYNYFPYDVYKDEDKIANWKSGDKVTDITDTTSENSKFEILNSKLSEGWYKVVATTKDKYGEEVRAEKYFEIDNGQQVTSNRKPINIQIKKQSLEPGDKIEYSIQTGLDKIWLIHTISKMNDVSKTDLQAILQSKGFINNIPVTESDRGGVMLNYVFVKHNRVYQGTENFNIPWSNKELNIAYETFREKLLPGSQEKYTVKISGHKGEKVAAEVLAGMYDASLDQFAEHSWEEINIWPSVNNYINWQSTNFREVNSDEYNRWSYSYLNPPNKSYDRLSFTNAEDVVVVGYGGKRKYLARSQKESDRAELSELKLSASADIETVKFTSPKIVKDEMENVAADSTAVMSNENNKTDSKNDNIQIRKNFNETAFFFPDLRTDTAGNVSFSFTIPEALTKWKLMTLAHTKDLASTYTEKTLITQKPLMVQPNAPRFMREGDRMEFSAKIVNLENKEMTGTATLELLDASTGKPVDGWFKNVIPSQYFTVEAGQSTAVQFPIEIPFNFNSALTYRIVAKAGNFSDGEEMALPVLTNRMLVTESMPLNMRGIDKKEFKFEKLINSEASETLNNHALTVEYTSNPAWYAVQALPYLMEYPYECAEQTFNRYYANILASYICSSIPKIKNVFEKWKNVDTSALLSNLQKNEELKSALLQETPWVLAAQNENQQKKNIALLFDLVKLSTEGDKAVSKLKEMQSPNGGFVWFKGGPDDRYITQYIITGIGHLKKLNALTETEYQKVKDIVDKAVPYLDKKITEDYKELIKHKVKLPNNNLSYTAIQYLYMRSFFGEYKISNTSQTAYTYYRNQTKKYWLSNSKYMQAMIALALYRTDENQIPRAIIRSLKENSITKEEMGMYWKEWTTGGYYWHQAPIESQAMMIELFTDIDKDNSTIDDLKTWLLKQKQTQNWKTTKATAEACYALLLNGSDWLTEEKEVIITLGNTTIKSTDDAAEAGTGYFKKRIEGEKVNPDMGNIVVSLSTSTSKPLNSTSWGSVYWQYFEDLDKITPSATPLQLEKKLFVEKNSAKGPVLVAINNSDTVKIGDKIKVRIVLKVDRDMEYVHMKDMRAACMEPVNVISEYKWQDGLGYYESTKDASTNFFFGSLSRGTYVFEYPMFVTHTGNFSNGITSIQCMYAPEFTSHSEGIRVIVE